MIFFLLFHTGFKEGNNENKISWKPVLGFSSNCRTGTKEIIKELSLYKKVYFCTLLPHKEDSCNKEVLETLCNSNKRACFHLNAFLLSMQHQFQNCWNRVHYPLCLITITAEISFRAAAHYIFSPLGLFLPMGLVYCFPVHGDTNKPGRHTSFCPEGILEAAQSEVNIFYKDLFHSVCNYRSRWCHLLMLKRALKVVFFATCLIARVAFQLAPGATKQTEIQFVPSL